jgi:cell division protein FtsB
VNLRRLFLTLYLAAFAALAVALGVFFVDAREQVRQLQSVEREDARQLAEAEARLQAQEVVLNRLRTDRDYVEKVIRHNLGYAKPDEFIFRFDDSPNGP